MAITDGTFPIQSAGHASRLAYAVEASHEATLASTTGLPALTALKILDASFPTERDRIERGDKMPTAGIYSRFNAKTRGTFTINAYVLPSGTAGTAPDLDPLLNAAGLSSTNSPATHQRYAPDGVFQSLFFIHDMQSVSKFVYGAYVTSVQWNWTADNAATVTIEGIYSHGVDCATTTLNNGGVVSATDTTFTVADASLLQEGAFIQVGTDDNTGAGYRISNLNTTTNVVTVSPQIATGSADLLDVGPTIRIVASTGSPIDGNSGSLTVDAVALTTQNGFVRFENTLGTNENTFGADRFAAVWLTRRDVTFNMECFASRSNALQMIESQRFASHAIVANLGSVAGDIVEITMPTAEFNAVPNFVDPERDAISFTIDGLALENAGNDQIQIDYQ